MLLFIAFMFSVVMLSVWELGGGPRWRAPLVLAVCAVLAVGFMSQRIV